MASCNNRISAGGKQKKSGGSQKLQEPGGRDAYFGRESAMQDDTANEQSNTNLFYTGGWGEGGKQRGGAPAAAPPTHLGSRMDFMSVRTRGTWDGYMQSSQDCVRAGKPLEHACKLAQLAARQNAS